MDTNENNNERLKLAKHYQHARLLKEENEEVWISSEDLRTEGSSSEDEAAVSNHLKLPKPKKHNKRNNNKKTTVVQQRFHEGDGSENSAAGCSKNDQLEREALNLESQWRPKRGSLKLSQLVAADGHRETVENFNNNEIDRFYNEMLNKVSLLRENPLTENNYKEPKNLFDGKENDIPSQVDQKLNFIRKLDDNLLEIIHQYQYEKMERTKLYEQNRDDDDDIFEQVCTNIQVNLIIENTSMTDEDKQKLYNLLENIDEDDSNVRKNAFALNDDDKKRIEQINMAVEELNHIRTDEKS